MKAVSVPFQNKIFSISIFLVVFFSFFFERMISS